MMRVIRSYKELRSLDLYIREVFEVALEEVLKRLDSVILCFEEPCKRMYLVEERLLERIFGLYDRGVEIQAAGVLIGLIYGELFIPSPRFLELLYGTLDTVRGAVIAREEGVRVFLYGRDLLYESVVEILRPFRKKLTVAVIDRSDNRVVGVGFAAEDADEILRWPRTRDYMRRPVVYNIIDLGLYLRAQDEDLY
ncbi:MAG: hypothetical protein QXS89_03040 [Sulfolobales archaeon]